MRPVDANVSGQDPTGLLTGPVPCLSGSPQEAQAAGPLSPFHMAWTWLFALIFSYIYYHKVYSFFALL